MPEILSYPDFSGGGLTAGTTLRGEDFALLSLESRLSFARSRGFVELSILKQVHSGSVHLIDQGNREKFQEENPVEGDGIFTLISGILLGIMTADCAPVFYTDDKKSIAGIAHAGWKGIKKKVHINIVRDINTKLGAFPENLHVQIGPHIGKCCYDVSPGLIDELGTYFFESRGGKIFLDLEAVIIDDLIRAGVPAGNIKGSPLCTKCCKNPYFYSYRGGDSGARTLSFIGVTS